MQIDLNKDKKEPIYQQIYEQLKEQIYSGELSYKELLPPERKLAQELNVNRTTILNAYNKLKQEGLIDSRIGQGTRVLWQSVEMCQELEPEWNQFFNTRLSELNGRMIGKVMPLLGKTEGISFALGMADPDLIPDLHFEKLEKQFLEEGGKRLLSQSPVAGSEDLKKSISHYLKKREIPCSPDQMMILTGSQQGIDLCSRVLLQPGDLVVVESPTYFLACNSFQSAGAKLMEVPVDECGMQTDRLEQILKRYHPKLIYTVPTNQNPSSYTLSLERRKRLLFLAAQYNVLILEDDAYADLNFENDEIPTLYQMDHSGYVIYVKTFSKTICSGIRLGFMLGHKRLIAQCLMLRQSVDIHPNNISQFAVSEFIKSGEYEKHLETILSVYKKRRDFMHQTLLTYAPKDVYWVKPEGGFYFWCRLPKKVRASELFERCLRQGVVFMPGLLFFLAERGEHYIRLNYTTCGNQDIETGLKIICDNIKIMVAEEKEEDQGRSGLMPIY